MAAAVKEDRTAARVAILTVPEVAGRLNVSDTKVRRILDRCPHLCHKVRAYRLVLSSDLDRVRAAIEAPSTVTTAKASDASEVN